MRDISLVIPIIHKLLILKKKITCMIWMKLKLTYTFSNFDEIQGLLAMIKSFKFAFYFICHI